MSRFCFFLWVWLVGPVVALAGPVAVWTEIPEVSDCLVRSWEVDDGLPHNRVLGIAQTADGYLWFGTSDGLARFDGARFTLSAETVSETEARDHVPAVFVARDGALWVGSIGGGVGRRLAGRWEIVVPESPDGRAVTAFAEDGEGAVWFSFAGAPRIGRWRGGRVDWFSGADGLTTGRRAANHGSVVASKTGRLWFGNADACGWFDGRRFTLVDPSAGPYVHLAAAADGGMWATRDATLVRYDADGRGAEAVADLGSLSVTVLLEDSSGALWLGSNNAGLVRYRDGEFSRVPVASAVTTLFEDDEGALWAGTLGGGAVSLRPRRLRLRGPGDGLPNADVYSICGDAGGRLWLAGRNRMLVRGDDARNRTFSPIPGWGEDRAAVMTVVPAPDGGVWLGTLGGLVRWRDGEFRQEAFHEPLTALLTDRAGDLWMATTRGEIFIKSGDAYRPVEAPETAGSRLVALAQDGAGRIWAGGLDGRVFVRGEGRFLPVALPGAGGGGVGRAGASEVRFIAPDGADTVWIGVHHGGLYRWRAGRVSRLPADAGLPLRDVRMVARGGADDIWIGTTGGLFQVSGEALDAVWDGRASRLPVRGLGRRDGLPPVEFALGFRGSTARTPDGHLWFATTLGALDIDPRAMVERPVERRVLIEEVWSGETVIARGGGAGVPEFPPRAPRIRIDYTLPQAGQAERLRFRYRLLGGGDDGWVENGELRSAVFSHLPAGSYRFEVVAGLDDGTWSPGGAGLDFVVRARWWETPAARGGALLAALGAVAWLVRAIVLLRVRARIRGLRLAREVERERARIARDMHDELGANLTQINMVSRLACMEPPEAARGHLEEIATIARRTVDSLDEIVWAVNPRYDTLAALFEYLGMYAAAFLASARIACETELPEDPPPRPLSANLRYHLFLAVKEALNNAAKHSGARTVRLKAGWDGARLRVEVADDGRGFDPEEAARMGADGLKNLRERMRELDGVCRIESGAGRGARVVLELPLPPERSGLASSPE